MKHPNPDMLVYIGLADAYAMATEYLKLPAEQAVRQEALKFERYVRHPRHQERPGQYTDDTEMSCANARVLISHPPPYTRLEFADAYVAEFQRGGKRKGYSQKFQTFLESVSSGEEFLQRVTPNSDKNGAAMRAVPFGVLPDVADVLHTATFQATLTHDTPAGRFSARAVALMAHYTLYEDAVIHARGKVPFKRYLLAHLPSEDACYADVFLEWRGPVTSKRMPVSLATVGAVYSVLTSNTQLMSMLSQIIGLGGDTDSVAAIVWGIASAGQRDEKLPAFLERDLEGGDAKTGTPYLRDLGERLMLAYT